MIGEPCSVPSNVTECSTGSRLVQRTDCPASMVTVWPANFMAAMATSAAIAAPAGSPDVTGLGQRVDHGQKRFRRSGVGNSEPESNLLTPIEVASDVDDLAPVHCD